MGEIGNGEEIKGVGMETAWDVVEGEDVITKEDIEILGMFRGDECWERKGRLLGWEGYVACERDWVGQSILACEGETTCGEETQLDQEGVWVMDLMGMSLSGFDKWEV